MDGFESLFSRYLMDNIDQPSIDWGEIQPPPEGTVRSMIKKTETMNFFIDCVSFF